MTIEPQKLWSRGLSLLAVAAASVALVGCSPFGGGTATPYTPPGDEQNTDVFTIEVGECLNDTGAAGEVSEVPTIDCAKPHDKEVYASATLPDGDYPGEDAARAQADSDCASAFTTFVGVPYVDSTLYLSYYYPTEQSWDGGDREVLCLIYDDGVKVTGSLEGAAR
jgi:hypothetical protein